MSTSIFTLTGVFLFICDSFAKPLQDTGLPLNINVCKRSEADYSNCLTKAIQDAWPIFVKAKSINVCKRSEDDYSSCLANAIQQSWPIFVKGIPELGSPKLEPLKVERVERNLRAGSFIGSIVLRDVTFYGLANTKILSAQPQFTSDRIKLELDVEIPNVMIECDYKAQGSVNNNFNVGGKGHFNITMDDLTAKWTLEGRVRNDRWIVEHFRIDPEIKGMKVYFSDLLNGNQLLNDAAMLFVNQYWPVFFNGMKPIIVELSDAQLSNFVNRIIFSKVSVSKIFPDRLLL